MYLSKRQRLHLLKADLDLDYQSFYLQYKDLNDFFMPSRGRFVLSQDSNRGDRRNTKIIDNTGYLSARTLASGMQAGVTSPARPWKRLTTPDPGLAEFGPVREWLDIVDQRMSTFFLRSNLYNVLPTAYGDLGVFGTAAIFMDKDFETVTRFKSFPIGSYRIAKDDRGRVNVFYREFRMTVRQLINTFGRKDEGGKADFSIFSKHVIDMYNKGNYEAWVEVCHVIEPNEDYNPRALSSKFKKFHSCYYERNCSDDDENKYLRESGYDYFPVLVPRWQATGQDVYATDCPGMAALGDNKQLQASEKRYAQAIDKLTNPPLKGSAGLKNSRVSLQSGDINWMEDPNDKLEAVHEIRIDLSHLGLKQEELRGRIKKAFFEDVFLPILENPRADRTATEVNQIKDERMLAMGPVLEQLNQDVLDPLIDNQFFEMVEAGMIPPAPKELQGMPLKVEYISIMAQAQKLVGIGGMDRLLQMASAIAALSPNSPQALSKIDLHQYIDEYADSLGIPPKIVRSDDKVEEILQGQAQAAQQQQSVQTIGELSGAAKNLSQTDMESDNALTRLLDQANAGQLTKTAI